MFKLFKRMSKDTNQHKNLPKNSSKVAEKQKKAEFCGKKLKGAEK